MRGQYDMEHVNDTSKYYWLKLERGFFKRHDITIIENYGGYPDGQLMVNLYMRLLAESIDHNGNLRFSAEKPYNNLMLSAITGIDIKVVEKGMECFKEFELIKVLNDGTIFMTKVEKMLGVGSSTERVRAYRERQKEVQKNDVVNEDVEVEEEIKPKKPKPLKEPTMKNDELFEQFWSVYPRKVGKDKCQKWFKIRKITQEFVDDLVVAINLQKKSEQWAKDDGQYIPHPYTWLNRGGWNDELKYSQPIGQKISKRWENFLNGNEE